MKKIILITGCSSGFGKLTALRLARDHVVYATMRTPKPLEHCIVRPLDVTQPDSIQAVIDDIKKEYGRLDVLINNAGYGLGGFFETLSEQEIRDQFETNFFGLQSVTRSALPLLRQTPDSQLINISSIAGLTGTPALGAYNASKWAVEGFSESLRFELKPFGVHVVLVEPGAFKTEIFTTNLVLGKRSQDPQGPYFKFMQHILDRFEKGIEKLTANPEDVASVIHNIIKTKKPQARYLVGKDAKRRARLKRWLPFQLYEKLVQLAINYKI